MASLLDTSVVINWHDPEVVRALPDEVAISVVTAAELAAGPHLAKHAPREAAARQARLQEVESTLDPIRFDGAAVRSCGLVVTRSSAKDAGHAVDSQISSSQRRHAPVAWTSIPETGMTSLELIIWSAWWKSDARITAAAA
jgi:predicted nucleic acid-binding protein